MFICDVTMGIFCNIKSKKLQLRFYLQHIVTLKNYSSINLQQNANISIEIPVPKNTVMHQTFSLNIFGVVDK
jgi:hypothetical protein